MTRPFDKSPKTYQQQIDILRERGMQIDDARKTYNTLVIILHLMDIIAPDHHWRKRLLALIDSHGIDVSHMGFPESWREFPVWEVAA